MYLVRFVQGTMIEDLRPEDKKHHIYRLVKTFVILVPCASIISGFTPRPLIPNTSTDDRSNFCCSFFSFCLFCFCYRDVLYAQNLVYVLGGPYYVIVAFPEYSQISITCIWAAQAKTCFQTCAKCADSHHNARAQNLIRAFSLH